MQTNYEFILNGADVSSFVEWKTSEVLATFDNEANQANITIDKVTFVNENARYINTWIEQGKFGGVGIFEGIPFQIRIYDETNSLICFDGMIDLANDYEFDEFANKAVIKIRKDDELFTLEEQLSALSFGYLMEIGVITQSDFTDVKYIVQKKFNILETLMLGIMTYMLAKEVAEASKTLAKDIADVTAHFSGGLTGPIAAIAFSIAVAILDAIYLAVITAALITATSKLIDQFIPIKRNAKTLKLKTALEKVAAHLGKTLKTNIDDMDVCYFMPSNYYQDLTNVEGLISDFIGTKKGIPNINDAGYNCADFFEICRKHFNIKFSIQGNELWAYNNDDLNWVKQSSFVMPDNRDKTRKYNTKELIANRYYTFDVDQSDTWTVSEYQGTSYEVITDAILVNDKKKKLIKGFNEVRFGVCLAHSKSKTSGLEYALLQIAKLLDNFCGTNYASKITSSVGLIVVSDNNYLKPKIIKLTPTKKHVPRSQWSAKYIYEKYYRGTSFIQTINGIPFYGQKRMYDNVKIGFGLSDFLTLVNSNYITDEAGNKGKATELTWNFDGKVAKVSYFIREHYTSNLKEIFIEPQNID